MWTLDEALRRTLSFGDAQRLAQLRRELPAEFPTHEAELKCMRDLLSEASILRNNGSDQAAAATRERALAIEAGVRDDRERWNELSDELDTIQASFCTIMAAGRLAAFGQREGGNGELVAIPAAAWSGAEVDWDGSAVRHGPRADRVRMVSVRVRPLLHLPGAPALPTPRSLALVFRAFVLDDPTLAPIIDRANGCFPGDYACMCSEVSRGMFTDESALWPAAIEEYDLVVEWMDAFRGRFNDTAPVSRRGMLDHLAEGSREDRDAFRVIRAAEAVVLDRVTRFLEPLRSGAVVATGTKDGLKGHGVVPRAVWSSPAARIDFMRSELLTVTDGLPVRVWSGLVLSRPEAPRASPAAPVVPVAAPRNKGGRPTTHAWEDAYDRLAIKLGRKGFPENGAGLARLMAECFTDMRAEAPDHEAIIGWLKKHKMPLWKEATGG